MRASKTQSSFELVLHVPCREPPRGTNIQWGLAWRRSPPEKRGRLKILQNLLKCRAAPERVPWEREPQHTEFIGRRRAWDVASPHIELEEHANVAILTKMSKSTNEYIAAFMEQSPG